MGMLKKGQKYLQIALNSTLEEAERIISQLPQDKRILIEAGTPLIKAEGISAVSHLKEFWRSCILGTSPLISSGAGLVQPESTLAEGTERVKVGEGDNILEKKLDQAINNMTLAFKHLANRAIEGKTLALKSISSLPTFSPYLVADLKTADLAQWEVGMAIKAGASAITCLGIAPVETIDFFIQECKKQGVDAMLDMMNVPDPLLVLEQLKEPPGVVILHRGVDEENFNKEKELPYLDIQRIKNSYDILLAVAGGDDFQEVQRAILNDADIVVVWKSFYISSEQTAFLAERFLREIR